MQRIKQRVKQKIGSQTKKQYQKTVQYLLKVIKILLSQQKQEYRNNRSILKTNEKEKREYSQGNRQRCSFNLFVGTPFKNKFPKQDMHQSDSSQEIDQKCFSGSQLSFVQRINRQIAGKQENCESQGLANKIKNKEERRKINKRGLQQTIQIYHQCLQKSLDLIKNQSKFIHNKTPNSPKPNEAIQNLDSFWQKYTEFRRTCKKFDQLISITKGVLATKFLGILHPFFVQIVHRFEIQKEPKRYLVFLSDNN